MVAAILTLLAVAGIAHAAVVDKRQSATPTPTTTSTAVPDYFDTTAEAFRGMCLALKDFLDTN